MSNTKQQVCPDCGSGKLLYFQDMLKCEDCSSCYDIPTQQIDEVKEDWKGAAIFFAESKMVNENWDRKDHILVGCFYKHYFDYIESKVITPLQTSNQQLKAKVDFYREQTDQCRKYVFEHKEIGEPNQPLWDAILDYIKEIDWDRQQFVTTNGNQQSEIEQLREQLKESEAEVKNLMNFIKHQNEGK